MKKILKTAFVLLAFQTLSAQQSSVEKSIFTFQTGLLGVWASNELRLSDEITLRSEIGLDTEIFDNDISETSGFFMAPTLNIEPRWYYNIKKREAKGKTTANNSANFLTLSFRYHPDWFVISNNDNIYVQEQLAIIPKWGIRRTIGNSGFNYEAGIGLGYRFYFLKQYGYSKNDSEATLDLHLRIGYTF